MTQPLAQRQYQAPASSGWAERDALGRRAMLTEILAQVSSEPLQGETLESLLQAIVDCLLLVDCSLGEASVVGERLRLSVAVRALEHPPSPIASQVTVSVGIDLQIPDLQQHPDELVRRADLVMYRAKALGRNRVWADAALSDQTG